jgi:hypothetical protein
METEKGQDVETEQIKENNRLLEELVGILKRTTGSPIDILKKIFGNDDD